MLNTVATGCSKRKRKIFGGDGAPGQKTGGRGGRGGGIGEATQDSGREALAFRLWGGGGKGQRPCLGEERREGRKRGGSSQSLPF